MPVHEYSMYKESSVRLTPGRNVQVRARARARIHSSLRLQSAQPHHTRMELSLHQVDLLQTAALRAHTLQLLPKGRKKMQKVVVGDSDGIVTCFSIKKGDPVVRALMTSAPRRARRPRFRATWATRPIFCCARHHSIVARSGRCLCRGWE